MSSVTRRGFLGASAAGLTAAAYGQVAGANERLRVGVIGCGGMAQGHMQTLMRNKEKDNVEIVAVCDLYQKRLDAAAQMTGGRPYKDYREVLALKDVDYILNATPEHWHAQITLDAADADKHIYCEKPMTRTVDQSKRVVAKLKSKPKLKMQVGVQGTSDESYVKAYEYIKSGAIGTVVLAQIDYSRNTEGPRFLTTHKEDPDLTPSSLDWNRWLGYTPKRPFDPARFLHWREYWDYSAGISGDLFVHRITRLIKALNLTFPSMVVATGGKFEFKDSPAEIPDTLNALLDYPQGLTVQLISSMANATPVEHLVRGHKATIVFNRKGFIIRPERMFAKDVKEVVYEKKGAEDIGLHHRNLMAAIRTNEPLNCDINIGYYGVVASEMVVQSFRKRKYLKWDAQREKIVKA